LLTFPGGKILHFGGIFLGTYGSDPGTCLYDFQLKLAEEHCNLIIFWIRQEAICDKKFKPQIETRTSWFVVIVDVSIWNILKEIQFLSKFDIVDGHIERTFIFSEPRGIEAKPFQYFEITIIC